MASKYILGSLFFWSFGVTSLFREYYINRILNFILSFIGLIILMPIAIIVTLFVKLTSKGPAIYWSKRVGKNNKIFLMPKFRTMSVKTPQMATHLMTNSENFLTPIGPLLRKTSLDEVPQLWSVLVGDMNLVGPRPALFNQDDLITLRTTLGVHEIPPGITGWAQINGRDELPIPIKVEYDREYLERRSLFFDLKIIFLTILKVVRRENVRH